MDSTSDTRVITQDEVLQSFGTSINNGNAQINSTKTSRVSTGTLYCQGDAYIYGCVRTPLKLCNGGVTFPPGSATLPAINFGDEDSGLYGDGSKTGISSNGTTTLLVGDGAVQVNGQLTTGVGNLVINPAGSSVDFTNHDIINVNNFTANNITAVQSLRAYDPATVATFQTVTDQSNFVSTMQVVGSTITPPQFQLRFNPGVYNLNAVTLTNLRPITYVGDQRFSNANQRPSVRGATSTWSVSTGGGNTTITFSGAYIPSWTAFGAGDTCWVVDDSGTSPLSYPVVSTTSNSVTFTGTPSITSDGCAIWMQPNVIFEASSAVNIFQVEAQFNSIYFRSTSSAVRSLSANSRMQFQRCYFKGIRIAVVANCDCSINNGASWDVLGSTNNECVDCNNPIFTQQHTFVGSSADNCVGLKIQSRGTTFIEANANFINLRTGIEINGGSLRTNGIKFIGSTAPAVSNTTGLLVRAGQICAAGVTYSKLGRAQDFTMAQYVSLAADTFTGNLVDVYDTTYAFCNLFSTASAAIALTGGVNTEITAAGFNWQTINRTVNNSTLAHRIDLIAGSWLVNYAITLQTTNGVTYTTSAFATGSSISRSTSQHQGAAGIATIEGNTMLTIAGPTALGVGIQASVNDNPTILSVRLTASKII